MLSERALIREPASQIAAAALATLADLREGLVEQEPNFTDRMLGRIAAVMDGYKSRGVVWRAKTLTAYGANSQESRFGADFVATLNIGLPDYVVHKGFLGQAKLIGRRSFRGDDQDRLSYQCRRMLALSPASFVFVYSEEAIRVLPAIAVLASDGRIDERTTYYRSIRRFYEEHFACFIGDPSVSAPSVEVLGLLLERYQARHGLWLDAEPEDSGRLPRDFNWPIVEPLVDPTATPMPQSPSFTEPEAILGGTQSIVAEPTPAPDGWRRR